MVDHVAALYEFRRPERARTPGGRPAGTGDEVWRRRLARHPVDVEGHARGPGRAGRRIASADDRAAQRFRERAGDPARRAAADNRTGAATRVGRGLANLIGSRAVGRTCGSRAGERVERAVPVRSNYLSAESRYFSANGLKLHYL